jgi:phosphoserine phosphatase
VFETIKFANSIQEDLRRERSQFFTYGLREVCETLKNSGVDDHIASAWIQELVKSYTKSLDVSSELATNQVVNTIGELKNEAKKELKKVTQVKTTDKTSDE